MKCTAYSFIIYFFHFLFSKFLTYTLTHANICICDIISGGLRMLIAECFNALMLNAKCLLPIYLPSRAKLRFIFIFPLPAPCCVVLVSLPFFPRNTIHAEWKRQTKSMPKKATALDAID